MTGASDKSDRAVVNGANELSPPLRASVPSAARIWREAYSAVYGCNPTHPDGDYLAAHRVINDALANRAELPEYGEWLPDVWDTYIRELVGWDDVRNWASLPATFRWHEFHERLSKAIAARKEARS